MLQIWKMKQNFFLQEIHTGTSKKDHSGEEKKHHKEIIILLLIIHLLELNSHIS